MKHFFSFGLSLLLPALAAQAQAPTLVTRLPDANAPAAPRNTPVELTFSEAMSAQTAAPDAVRVVSQWRGQLAGTYSGAGISTIRFQPGGPLLPGEPLTVGVTPQATSLATGTPVVPSYYQFMAQVLTGTGRFGSEIEDLGVGIQPRCVAIGDFNTDGWPDLVVANVYSNSVSVRLGQGNGTFTRAADVAVGSSPSSVTVGDFNVDGNLDLAISNFTSRSISIRLGQGNGIFTRAADVVSGNINATSEYVATGDFNADGKPDLVVAKYGSRTISILLGRGDGTFTSAADVPAAEGARFITVADLNADGKLDLVIVTQTLLNIRLGQGDGTFTSAADVTIGTTYFNSTPFSVAVTDLNADGRPDLAIANFGNSSVSIRLGQGDGSFTSIANVGVGESPSCVVAGDFDADGKPDLAVANFDSNSVSIRLGQGDGSFTSAQEVAVGSKPLSIVAVDMDGDGDLDLAVANSNTSTVVRVDNTVSIRLNRNSPAGPLAVRSEAGKVTGLRLFPNPATGRVQMLSANAKAEVQVLSLQGRELRRFAAGTTQLDLHGLAAGLYLVRCGRQAARLVVE